jgi:hypothetical protein
MAPLPQAGQVSLAPLSSEVSTERSPVDRASRRTAPALSGTDLSCILHSLSKFRNPAKSDRGTRPLAAL